MSTSLAFTLSLLWVLLLVGVTAFNFIKARKELFFCSLFVLFMYAAGHLANSLWLMPLPPIEVIEVHYLFFALMQLIVAAGLYVFSHRKMTTMMAITISFLILEAFLTFAIHVDRNVVALNTELTPNLYDSRHWWLWDFRDVISICNSVTVLAALNLAKVFSVKTDDPHDAYVLLEKIEAYVGAWSASAYKDELLQKSQKSAELLLNHELGHVPKTASALRLLQQLVNATKFEPEIDNRNRLRRALYWLRS